MNESFEAGSADLLHGVQKHGKARELLDDSPRAIRRICVITDHYPSPQDAGRGSFVAALVDGFLRSGVQCDVIAPLAPRRWRHGGPGARSSSGGAELRVLRPRYVSLSAIRFRNRSTAEVGAASFAWAVRRAARSLERPDAVYAHFLSPAGFAALSLGETWDIPAFMALGESTPERWCELYPHSKLSHVGRRAAGFVCVGPQLREFALTALGASADQCLLAPNAVDTSCFRPRSKPDCRARLSLPTDRLILIFVGSACERKGIDEFLAALERIPEARAVVLGQGRSVAGHRQVLVHDVRPHQELAEWLNAADVMVLPTRREGCCNAINEALACGLPVVSSDIEEVRAQVYGPGVRLVDPRDPSAIAEAVESLLRFSAGVGRTERENGGAGKPFDLADRAGRILDWMQRHPRFLVAKG